MGFGIRLTSNCKDDDRIVPQRVRIQHWACIQWFRFNQPTAPEHRKPVVKREAFWWLKEGDNEDSDNNDASGSIELMEAVTPRPCPKDSEDSKVSFVFDDNDLQQSQETIGRANASSLGIDARRRY